MSGEPIRLPEIQYPVFGIFKLTIIIVFNILIVHKQYSLILIILKMFCNCANVINELIKGTAEDVVYFKAGGRGGGKVNSPSYSISVDPKFENAKCWSCVFV